MTRRESSRLFVFVATFAFVALGTVMMIRYAKGYRPTLDGTIRGTGLLAANSFPTGAEVYINDRLNTATDATINLDPGEYQIEIRKDGYFSWSKKMVIQKELVSQTNAMLFPVSPALEPLTFTGAVNPVPSADGNKLAYAVASASAGPKNGLYVQDLSAGAISFSRAARQIARNTPTLDYTQASYTWSPNGSQILVSFEDKINYLLEADRFNDAATLRDVTATLPAVLSEWEEELARQERTALAKLPVYFKEQLLNLTAAAQATASATPSAAVSHRITNLYISPNREKLLYQGMEDFTLPEGLLPPLPSSSTQPETRDVKAGGWYVYDLKEDKNFLVAIAAAPSPSPVPSPAAKNTKATPAPRPFLTEKLLLESSLKDAIPAELGTTSSAFRRLQEEYSISQSISLFNAQYAPIHVTKVQWFPDSYHLILTTDTGINIVEYDNTNRTTVYAGPFDPSFVYPWPDGSKLVTKIQFSPDTIPNLYTIKLK